MNTANVITVDSYPEQEQYYADLCAALKAQREAKARSLYTLAYRSERNRYSIGRSTYWLDTGIAHIDCHLSAAMDSLAMGVNHDRIEDDRVYWRTLAKRLICRNGVTSRLIDVARDEIKAHYRNSSRYGQVFNTGKDN
jgi:predicted component of type VI protein secretion system